MEPLLKIVALLFLPLSLVAQGKPNIIFIMADDMGYAEVSYNDDTTFSTPAIDLMADSATVFTSFYAQSVCSPTRAALMTGKYPFRYGLHNQVVLPYDSRGLPDTVRTLPKYLKDAGYVTGIIGKWHLGHNNPNYTPQKAGFDYVFGNYLGAMDYYDHDVFGIEDIKLNGDNDNSNKGAYYTEVIGQAAAAWIEKQYNDSTTPFFCYIPFTTPHNNDQTQLQCPTDTVALAPGAYTITEKTKWCMHRIMDNEVERIWNVVRSAGATENTIIIFTSDNGPRSGEAPITTPFTGLKNSLNEGGLRVPFFWYHPGGAPIQTIDSIAHMVDILPTLVEGVAGLTPGFTDGENIYNAITGAGSFSGNRAIILHNEPGRMWAVRRGPWKLVNNADAATNTDTPLSESIELFNIQDDPAESIDLSGTYPALVAELQALVTAYDSEVQDMEFTGTANGGSAPPGWNDPAFWADPAFWYNANFLFQYIDYKQ